MDEYQLPEIVRTSLESLCLQVYLVDLSFCNSGRGEDGGVVFLLRSVSSLCVYVCVLCDMMPAGRGKVGQFSCMEAERGAGYFFPVGVTWICMYIYVCVYFVLFHFLL